VRSGGRKWVRGAEQVDGEGSNGSTGEEWRVKGVRVGMRG
jgi:hypothetical protein